MKDQIVHLNILSYNKKGIAQGISTQDNKNRSFEVKGAALGEEISAKVVRKKRKIFLAELVDIIKPVSFRLNTQCQHANSCGGCVWQHLSYEHQLQQKQEIVSSLFAPFFDVEKIEAIIASEELFHYRNKMEFSFSQDKYGHKYLGLIQSHSKGKVINLQECFLVNSWQVRLLKKIRSFFEHSALEAYNPYKDEGTFQTLILREGLNTSDKLVMLTVSGRSHYGLSQSDINEFKKVVLEEITDGQVSIYLRVRQAIKGQKTQFFEMHLHGKEQLEERLYLHHFGCCIDLRFNVSPSSFFQPNTHQAEKLFSKALSLVEKNKDMQILDLYSGTGTLSLIFASIAKSVIAIELNPYSVFDAIENAKLNNISHVQFMQGDAIAVLQKLKKEKKLERIDLVILDPPRSGVDKKGLKEIIEVSPREILYISCHPQSQKEDVAYLIEHGYEIKVIQPVDQFPHTAHIENIVLLRNSSN